MDERANHFLTTPWTLILAAQNFGDTKAAESFEAVCSVYWPMVHKYLRTIGLDRAEAEEATQSFFCDVVLGRGLFQRADRGRGRLRDLIRTALKNHRIDRHRSVGPPHLPLDPETQPDLRLSPSDWERDWATSLLSEALARTREYVMETAPEKWAVFEHQVLTPTQSGSQPTSQADAAEHLGLSSAAAVANTLFAVRQRLRFEILELIAASTPTADRAHELHRLEMSLAAAGSTLA